MLIHNLDPITVYGFCGVFWTLALEEHLYLAYFLLVSMRQRFGWPVILAVCLATRVVGLAAHWALKHYGSRYVEGGGTSGWGFHRRLLSEGAAREVEDLPGRGLPSDRGGVAAVSRAVSDLTRPGGSHTTRTITSEGQQALQGSPRASLC